MAFGKQQLEKQQQPSPDTPISAHKTVPPSPPLTSSSPSLSPLARPVLKAHSRVRRRRSAALLPPSVAGAYRCLQDLYRGRYTGPSWVRFCDVCPDDLEALLSATKSFKYRFDYEPSNQQLTLRMPEGSPHVYTKNGFARSILRCVQERIDRAVQEKEDQEEQEEQKAWAAAHLRSISLGITSNVEDEIEFSSGGVKRPDVAFSITGSRYPPFVVEIGHSQKAKSLASVARDYIDKTDGAIHTVLTARFIHLSADQRRQERRHTRDQQAQEQRVTAQQQPRRTTRSQTRPSTADTEADADADALISTPPASGAAKLAHISLYRLGRRVVHDQEFRDAQGRPRDGGIALSVADFVSWDERRDGDQDELEDRGAAARARLEQLTFTIPFAELCDALGRGEEQQLLKEQPPDTVQPARAGQKRVRFEWSDPEPEPEDEADDTDTDPDTNEDVARASSSSKRRRTGGMDDTFYRAARSSQRQQGNAVVAQGRRSSSRLSQTDQSPSRSQSHGRPGEQVVAYRRRRSSSRLSDRARG